MHFFLVPLRVAILTLNGQLLLVQTHHGPVHVGHLLQLNDLCHAAKTIYNNKQHQHHQNNLHKVSEYVGHLLQLNDQCHAAKTI